MSNDNPFAAPENGGSAPLQAPPVEQAQVPQFGAAPIMPPTASGWPVANAGIPAVAPRPLRASRGLPIAMAILGVVYVALCVAELFVLSHRVSLLNNLTGNVDADSGLLSQIDSATNTVNTLSWVALVVFLSIIVVLSIWLSRLRKTWGPTGQYHQLLKESGYQVFRAVWLISLLLSIFLRSNGTQSSVNDAISHDHRLMLYFGIRIVLGAILIYFSVRFARVTTRILTLSQAGYSPEAVNFLR